MTMGIMAAFITATLSGCSEPTTPVHAISSVDECLAVTGDVVQCREQWKEAQLLHKEVAPQFTSNTACSESFGDDCQSQRVQNTDGSFTDVFVPMMAGMLIGNMMSNSNIASQGREVYNTRTQPLYQEKEKRGGGYVPVNTMSTSTGSAVNKGSSFVSAKSATSVSKFSSPVSRGGFGMSARGGSASS